MNMSDTRQGGMPAKPEPTSGGKALPVSQPKFTSESTPAKRKYDANLVFAIRNELNKEMDGRWVGAMPVDLFFEKFLPAPSVPLPKVPDGLLKGVLQDGAESAVYSKFVSVSIGLQHLLSDSTTRSTRSGDGRLACTL